MSIKPQFVPKGLIYLDEAEKLRLETRNGVIQAEFILHKASTWNKGDVLEPALLLELQRLAVNQIYRCAGHFRDGKVVLQGVRHEPPDFSQVPKLVDEMLVHLAAHWQTDPPTQLAAYAMWRVNWIHPFFGGNGRTARAFSYLVLCLKLGFTPPAEEKTIPELIMGDREPYYEALRAADESWLQNNLDVSQMECLIASLLAQQLAAIHFRATGKPAPEF